MKVTLSLTGEHADRLRRHLFPADGCEAMAIALCGQRLSANWQRLLVQEVYPVPYDQCEERRPDLVRWPVRFLLPLLEQANRRGLSVVKIHGHHVDYPRFSEPDNKSDRALFDCLPGWVDADVPHGSAIFLSDGRMLGRTFSLKHVEPTPIERIVILDHNLRFCFSDDLYPDSIVLPEFTQRHAQAFGQKTVQLLGRLTAVVVGCSGTGSPTIEQLARLGVGRLILVDPDRIEEKNLNRIIHATAADIGRFKVDVIADAVRAMGLGTEVVAIPRSLFDREVVQCVANSDVLFGCMDSAEGRRLLNRLATYYLLPYIDLGVKLVASADGQIEQVSGGVHFLQPGKSSLLSRKVISPEQVRAEGLRRRNPEEYASMRRERYIVGVDEDRPAVISVNLMVSSMAINELLARLHDFRTDGNAGFAEWRVSISHGIFHSRAESFPCPSLVHAVGLGDVEPLLDDPELSA